MECARHEEYVAKQDTRYCGNCGGELTRIIEGGQVGRADLRSNRLDIWNNEVAWGGVLLLGYLTLNAIGYALATARKF